MFIITILYTVSATRVNNDSTDSSSNERELMLLHKFSNIPTTYIQQNNIPLVCVSKNAGSFSNRFI